MEEINKMKSGELDEQLELQKQVYTPRWDWNKRIEEWNYYLNIFSQQLSLISEPTSENSQEESLPEIQVVGL